MASQHIKLTVRIDPAFKKTIDDAIETINSTLSANERACALLVDAIHRSLQIVEAPLNGSEPIVGKRKNRPADAREVRSGRQACGKAEAKTYLTSKQPQRSGQPSPCCSCREKPMKIIHTINCVPFSDFERVARRHLPEIAKSLSSSMAT